MILIQNKNIILLKALCPCIFLLSIFPTFLILKSTQKMYKYLKTSHCNQQLLFLTKLKIMIFISPTAAADYNERFRDMYTFSELISNIRKVGKIDSRKMQGQSAFSQIFLECLTRNSNPKQHLIGTDQKPKKKWDNSTLNNKGRSGNALSNAITAMSSQTGSTLRDQALDQRHSI